MTWITIDQLAQELNISKRTLQNRLSDGRPMPASYKVGRKRLFKRDEVDEWIAKFRTETSLPLNTKGGV